MVFWRQKRKLSHFFYIFRKGKPKPPLTPSLTYCCFYFIFFLLRLFDRCRVQITQVPVSRRELVGLQRHLRWKMATVRPVRLGWKMTVASEEGRESQLRWNYRQSWRCIFLFVLCVSLYVQKVKEFRQDNKNRKFSFPRPR